MAKAKDKPVDEVAQTAPVEHAPPRDSDAEARIAELESDLRAAQKLCDAEREARIRADQALKKLGHDPSDLLAARQHIGPIGAPVAGPEVQGPLSFEDRQELNDLEARAGKGRQLAMPTPHEMLRLGKLRIRAKANA